MKLSEFTPNPKNPRKISDNELLKLKISIERFGDLSGIVWNEKTGHLVGAHQRLKILPKDIDVQIEKRLSEPSKQGTTAYGYAEIDGERFAIRIVSWSETEEKAANIAANKISGSWDFPNLADFLLDLDQHNFDLNLTGFDPYEIEDIMTYSPQYGPKENLGSLELDEDEFEALEELKETGEIRQTSMLSYYGGKQTIISKIIPLIPKHTVYVEPFCGGATLFFAKPWPKVTQTSYYREVLNDTNQHIVNFYKQMKENPEKLIDSLSFALYSRKHHEEAKEIYKKDIKDKDIDPLIAAHAVYVNIHLSFAKTLGGGWGTGVFGPNLSVVFRKKIASLPQYMDRLSEVCLECDDAINVIKRWDSPQTFFYLDPPYPNTHQGHYSGYSQENFNSLIETLKNVQGSFILSCYAQQNLPEQWEHFTIETVCSGSSRGKVGQNRNKSRASTAAELGDRKRTEHLWKKKSIAPVRPEIQALYRSGAFSCFRG